MWGFQTHNLSNKVCLNQTYLIYTLSGRKEKAREGMRWGSRIIWSVQWEIFPLACVHLSYLRKSSHSQVLLGRNIHYCTHFNGRMYYSSLAFCFQTAAILMKLPGKFYVFNTCIEIISQNPLTYKMQNRLRLETHFKLSTSTVTSLKIHRS